MASTPGVALQACLESAAQTARMVPGHRDCSPPSFEALQLSIWRAASAPHPAYKTEFSTSVGTMLISAAVAFLICLVIIRSDKLHAWFSHDRTGSGPQKFHAIPVARIGGIALAGALIVSLLLLNTAGWLSTSAIDGLVMLSLAATPAFAGGFAEDISKRVGV